MENVFLGCFLFGALFTLVSTLLGNLGPDAEIGSLGKLGKVGKLGKLGKFHAEIHAELPGDTGPLDVAHVGGAEGGIGHFLQGFLTLSAMVAFVTWFGAAGYVMLKATPWPLFAIVPVAVVAGVVGAGVIAAVLAKIKEGDRPMDPADYQLEGTLARVSVSIPENGVGEIVFSLAGTRRNEAARVAEGHAVASGEEVIVTGYDRGFAIVEPVRALLEGHHEAARLEAPRHRQNESVQD